MVALTKRCMELCSHASSYPTHQKQDTRLILLLSSVAISSIFITENLINISLTIISLAVCYGVIIKTRKTNKFDHTKYNYKSRHPAFKLIDELGWNKYYKNLINTVNNTKGFVCKPDTLYSTNYQIFNYYVTTIPEWNEYQILCRGLVLDPKRQKIIATSFPKFFNFGEFQNDIRNDLQNAFIAQQKTIQINEKMDGSLGIIFYCNTIKQWRCSTRGSFASRQAQWATKYLKTHRKIYENIFVRGHTYLAEIIFSDNKIIIEYDYDKLVLLAGYNENGYEYKYEYLLEISETLSPIFGISKRFYFNCIRDLQKATETLECEKEGWVVTYDSGMRVKFKGKEYLALAKLMQGINEQMVERVICEDGLSKKALLDTLPEEFHDIVTKWYKEIYERIVKRCKDIAYDVIQTNQMSNRDLGKWLNGKFDDIQKKIVFKSEVSKRMIFPTRKLINERLWKFDVSQYDIDEKVDEIVVEMMKHKDLKKKVMRK